MTGKAGLETSVVLVISIDRGCQSRSFNSRMSPGSWPDETPAMSHNGARNRPMDRYMGPLFLSRVVGPSGPDRPRVALSFGEAGRPVKRVEIGAIAAAGPSDSIHGPSIG